MIAIAGDSRRSSVPALNVSPIAPTVTPDRSDWCRPTALAILSTIRRRCSSFTVMTPRIIEKS